MRRPWGILVLVLILSISMVRCNGGQATCDQAPSGPMKTVRVSVKVILGEDGSRPVGDYFTDSQIADAVADANTALVQIGANWRLDLAEIVDAAGISQWLQLNCEDKTLLDEMVQQNPELYHFRNDAINVYIVDYLEGCGGVCSFPSGGGSIIVIKSDGGILNGGVGWLHEVGHFFGLVHTDDSSGQCIGGGGEDEDCADTCPDDLNVMGRKEGITPQEAVLTTCQLCIIGRAMDPDKGSRRNVIE